jgi:hypothetical protein
MSQSTLDDDELFGEAANEMREDVEESLAAARDSLPDADDIWNVDADNTLGVLNALRSALDAGDAEEHLRDAKKWYTMGERADAFDDADDLAADIEAVENLVADIERAHEQVGDLTSTVPQLRSALEEAEDGDADPTDDEFGTFDTLFATNHKFYGYMDYFLSLPTQAPAGLRDVHVEASMRLTETTGVSAKAHHFMEAVAPPGRSLEAYGQEVDLTFRYQFAESVSISLGASTFVPDTAIAPTGDTAYWGYVMTTIDV